MELATGNRSGKAVNIELIPAYSTERKEGQGPCQRGEIVEGPANSVAEYNLSVAMPH